MKINYLLLLPTRMNFTTTTLSKKKPDMKDNTVYNSTQKAQNQAEVAYGRRGLSKLTL